jgi:hypothetical protein
MTEPERAAEAERRRQKMMEEVRQKELRAQEQTDPEAVKKLMRRGMTAVQARIVVLSILIRWWMTPFLFKPSH